MKRRVRSGYFLTESEAAAKSATLPGGQYCRWNDPSRKKQWQVRYIIDDDEEKELTPIPYQDPKPVFVPEEGDRTYEKDTRDLAIAKNDHSDLQNYYVNTVLRSRGIEPLPRLPDDPYWDVAWIDPDYPDVIWLGEVKSRSKAFRYAMGQITEYKADMLLHNYKDQRIAPVIILDHQPNEVHMAQCQYQGVTAWWREGAG